MLRFPITPLLLATMLAGCPSSIPAAHAQQPSPPTQSSDPVRPLSIPEATPTGGNTQVRTLYDTPILKIVSIRLRNNTLLPEHSSRATVVIQAVVGSGTVLFGTRRVPVDPTHFVTLAPNTPHAVQPDSNADLVLVVHHHQP